ncbi:MAG: cation-transporting P-type ATPase [Caldilineaceae bacterium]
MAESIRSAGVVPAPTASHAELAPQDDVLLPRLPVAEVYPFLHTSVQGITADEAIRRLQSVGPNRLQEAKGQPLYLRLLANFGHTMALLLWVGGLLALVAQMPQLAVAIWAVNLINGAFSFWQEYKAEKATEALRKMLPHNVRVVRGGSELLIPAEELVPGDLMLLAEGDRISADARLIEESDLRVDQSTLSGESHPVRKTCEAVLLANLTRAEIPNLIFAGTNVAAGTARAVVFATGMQTEFGKIAQLTQSVGDELSPLQLEMSHVTRIVTVVALVAGLLFFALALLMKVLNLVEGFIFAMGMIVAFVPEGLLPTVTLALAMGTQRMAKRNALIKRLSAVETLGCTSVICTDKTGTLTQNEMTVCNLWQAGKPYRVSGVGYVPEGKILLNDQRVDLSTCDDLRQLLIAATLCNNARLLRPNDTHTSWSILGDPTEAALIVAAAKAGIDLEQASRDLPRIRELPFDSRRKRMSTVHAMTPATLRPLSQVEPDDELRTSLALVKGAPKEVLALCNRTLVDGQELSLDEAARAACLAANDDFARNGLRVLAVAQHKFTHGRPVVDGGLTVDTVERDLTLLGLVAMMDPPRPEVAAAVKTCHQAGIRIVMITGDYGLTAESIARRVGIVRGDQVHIISGLELNSLSDAQLKESLQAEVIFARVSPEDKLRVVAALQGLGHVVAVTGDGVNDAPALKKADIGVAMGLAGTDVAKESADMILTDDNFASIVNAVEEGRAVYSNIKKFITYIFTSNTPEAIPFIAFVLTAGRIPLALTVMQILSVDLGTDLVPALALGAEPPEPGVMERPPRKLSDHMITIGLLLRAYPFLGLVQSLAAMAAFYFQYWSQGYWGQWFDLPSSGWLYQSATAMTLGAIVTTQIGNLLAQRTERISILRFGLFNNPLIWIGIATELLIVSAIIYLPPLQWIFGTAAFSFGNWLFLFAWTPSLLILDELRKAWVRRHAGA